MGRSLMLQRSALLKLKTGGKQKMQVQHIHIQGQAVVAQNLKTGGRKTPAVPTEERK